MKLFVLNPLRNEIISFNVNSAITIGKIKAKFNNVI